MNYKLEQRYVFKGEIKMETGLHLGGGNPETSFTDNAVMKTLDGTPFIPGSSFKGAFRSTVEKILPNIPEIKTCSFLLESNYPCMTVNKDLQDEYKNKESISKITEETIKKLKDKIDINKLTTLKNKYFKNEELIQKLIQVGFEKEQVQLIFNLTEKKEKGWDNQTNLEYLNRNLCDTCKLFGSPWTASRILFSDLYLTDESEWGNITEVRDGVVIDRDSEKAVDGLKYDYEVVPSGVIFDFTITVENPSDEELGIIAIGLNEFQLGMVPLGGIKSRGLGRCKLEKIKIEKVNFTVPEELRQYLLKKQMTPVPEGFLTEKTTHLLRKRREE